jgi:hypothetical protein
MQADLPLVALRALCREVEYVARTGALEQPCNRVAHEPRSLDVSRGDEFAETAREVDDEAGSRTRRRIAKCGRFYRNLARLLGLASMCI